MSDRSPSPEAVEAVLPEHVRNFARVTCTTKIQVGFDQLCRAIGEAFTRFERVPIRWKEFDLIVADDPIITLTPAGALSILPRKGVAAMAIGDVIVLRTSELLSQDYVFQVYAVLEELVHVLLNVQDESLVTWIVCFLYSDMIAYQNGRYVPAQNYCPHWPPLKGDWSPFCSVNELDIDAIKRRHGSRESPQACGPSDT